MASYEGGKLAKGVLSPKLHKKLNIFHAKAWGTYLIGSLIASGVAALAINVRDKVAGDTK